MNHRKERTDLSEWVLHFVHERKPENDISTLNDIYKLEGGEGELRYPDYYDIYGVGQTILSLDDENEYEIPEDASAFEVLLKILHDGYLHSGWSYRKDNPTIYGPVSAVCFTEMPLHSFIKYAEDRGIKTGLVSKYAIAVKRSELFKAGGRPVIYGLSSPHIETDGMETGVFQGRCLSIKETGLGLQEQYRYVATDLDGDRYKDWTHEREWRWPLPYDKMNIPGLSLYLDEFYGNFFSEIFVFVDSKDEKEDVLNYLKSLYDAKSWNNGIEYNTYLIKNIKVVSFEDIEDFSKESIVKVENLPFEIINTFPKIKVTSKKINDIKGKIEEAVLIAEKAMAEFKVQYPKESNKDFDWGWTYICTAEITETTQALIELGFSTYADGIYRKNLIKNYRDSLTTQLEGAEVAAQFLSKELGQHFFVKYHED